MRKGWEQWFGMQDPKNWCQFWTGGSAYPTAQGFLRALLLVKIGPWFLRFLRLHVMILSNCWNAMNLCMSLQLCQLWIKLGNQHVSVFMNPHLVKVGRFGLKRKWQPLEALLRPLQMEIR